MASDRVSPPRAYALRAFPIFLALMLSALPLGEAAIAQTPPTPRYSGRWSEPKEWGGTAVHLMLLPGNPSGSPASHSKILWWHGSTATIIEGGIRLWQTGDDTTCWQVSDAKFVARTLTTPGFDVFCSGHGHLADGRLLVAGGTAPIGEIGITNSTIFDPSTETWTTQPVMSRRRWYPSTTPLPDGRVMVASGSMFNPMYIFGGSATASGSAPSDNLYRLGLTESGDWLGPLTQVGTPGTQRPETRTGHTEVAENTAAQRWVFGGRKADGNYLNDTWIPNFNVPAVSGDWTYGWLPPRHDGTGNPGVDVPNGRMQHVAAILSDNSMVVFGGFGKVGGQDKVFEDVWRLRYSSITGQWGWQKLDQIPLPGQPGHPGARFALAAVNDRPRSRMLIFGGATNPQQTLADNEVYALTINTVAGTATWSKPTLRNPSSRPGARMGHALAGDEYPRSRVAGGNENRALLFGGRVPGGSPVLKSDLWTLWIAANGDLEWTPMTTVPDPTQGTPAARADHSLTYEYAAHRLILNGGDVGGGSSDNTMWSADMCSGGCADTYQPQWHKLASMPSGRAGHSAPWISNEVFAREPEMFTPGAGSPWQRRDDAAISQSFFPFNFQAPGTGMDTVFSVGPALNTYHVNTTTGSWTELSSSSGFIGGSAVMYRPGKVMKCGSRDDEQSTPAPDAVGTTKTIGLAPGQRVWQTSGAMMFTRVNHNLVVLPTGEVLVTGGTGKINNVSAGQPRQQPELWDPSYNNGDQGIWYGGGAPQSSGSPVLASDPLVRRYHSTALLLPDGRVLSAGGSSDPTAQTNVTLYSPPYLFDSQGRVVGSPGCTVARPLVSAPDPPSALTYGQSFVVNTPAAAAIASVCLIKPGAVTHGYDQNQRFVPLTFEPLADNSGLRVLAPVNGNDAPPGYYLLFIVNTDQVPAIARWVRVGGCTSPPCDTEPPPAVNNLYVDIVGPNEIWLAWSAPGDNWNPALGAYDVRYSTTSPITSEIAFAAATPVGEPYPPPAPGPVGCGQSCAKDGLSSCTSYYFAFKTRDGATNWSSKATLTAGTSCGGGGSGFSARRAGGESELTEGGQEDAATGAPSGVGRSAAAEAASLVPATGVLVAETRRARSGGWEVTLRLVSEPEGFDPALTGAIVSQVSDGGGVWKTLGRHQVSPGQSPLGLCALRDQGRVVFPAGYQLDRVVTGLREGSQELALGSATHSRLGALGSQFVADGGSVEMALGDVVTFTYAPSNQGLRGASSWYLLVRPAGPASSSATPARRALDPNVPARFALYQNQPNPFRQATTIAFDLPVASPVTVEVFDLLGRKVVTLAQGAYPAGAHSVEWNLRNASGDSVRPGVFVCRMVAGDFRARRKISVLP